MDIHHTKDDEQVQARVRFVAIPLDRAISTLCGIRLPPYGVFLDLNGSIIPIVFDDRDPFRRMMNGLFFAQWEARRALCFPGLTSMTTEEDRIAIRRDIETSTLPMGESTLLMKAIHDFNQPMWVECGTSPLHLHVCLRGAYIAPELSPQHGTITGKMNAGVSLSAMVYHGLIAIEDCERLLQQLTNDPQFRWVPK